jgi:DNA modification methylase
MVKPLGVNKIYCGDCLEILPKIPDDYVDIIITSPPYNFGMDYDVHDDAKEFEEYFKWLAKVWRECFRVLKHSGRICVNVQPLPSSYVPIHHIISNQLKDLGLLFKAEILWDKHNYNCKYTAWGSWKSPSMPYLKITWEFIEVYCKGQYKKEGRAEDIDITGDEFKKWTTVKWDIAPASNIMKKYDHPAVFPEELPRRLVKLFSYRGDLVLDPFNGVGTTTAVARELNRRFIGIEISKRYCEAAEERLSKVQPVLF